MSEFTIKIEAPELARAITNLAGALSVFGVALEESSKKTAAQVPAETPQTVDMTVESKEQPAEAKAAPTHHTIEEVRAAFSEYAKSKGKDKAKELLAKYGATKVTELKAEDYDAAIRDIREC